MKVLNVTLKMLALLLVIALFVGGAIFIITKKPELVGLAKGNVTLQKESDALIKEVGKLIALPTDEKPTIATVADIEKIKDQSFFKNAKNGDNVLIYTNTNKAILYRPSEKLIVEVGAVNVDQQVAAATPTPSNFKFIILNGTSVSGLTKNLETELKKVASTAEINKDNANKQDYAQSIIVDLAGNKTSQTEDFAKRLGVAVGTLPEGEAKPEGVDFLIIVGNDKAI